MLYRVTWEIDVDAIDPVDASRKAIEEMAECAINPDSINHIFIVDEITEDGIEYERVLNVNGVIRNTVDLDVIDGRV